MKAIGTTLAIGIFVAAAAAGESRECPAVCVVGESMNATPAAEAKEEVKIVRKVRGTPCRTHRRAHRKQMA